MGIEYATKTPNKIFVISELHQGPIAACYDVEGIWDKLKLLGLDPGELSALKSCLDLASAFYCSTTHRGSFSVRTLDID